MRSQGGNWGPRVLPRDSGGAGRGRCRVLVLQVRGAAKKGFIVRLMWGFKGVLLFLGFF